MTEPENHESASVQPLQGTERAPEDQGAQQLNRRTQLARNVETTQAHERRDHLASDIDRQQEEQRKVFTEMNFGGIDIPYDRVEQGELPETSFDELSEAVKSKNYAKAIKLAITLFFGDGNEVEALGYVAENMEHLDPEQKANVAEQLYAIDTKNLEYDKKSKTAVLRSAVGYSLFRQGYHLDRVAAPARTVDVAEGETLTVVLRREFPEKAGEILDEMQSEKVLGVLKYSEPFEAGMSVAFSEEGYPLYALPQGGEAVRSVPLFVKKSEALEEEKGIDTKARIQYLGTVVKPGDIVFPNERAEAKGPIKKAFVTIGRMVQATTKEEEGFHSIHAMVCTEIRDDGVPVFVHIRKGGGVEEGLDALQAESYNAVTVGRMDVSDSAKQDFVAACRAYASGVKDYGEMKAVNIGMSKLWAKFKGTDKSKPDAFDGEGSVCLDMVRHAAGKIGEESLSSKESALAMFKHLHVVESIEM